MVSEVQSGGLYAMVVSEKEENEKETWGRPERAAGILREGC